MPEQDDLFLNLAELQQELGRLAKAVEHIENAKKLAEDVIDASSELNEEYLKHIQAIKELVKKGELLANKSEELTKKIDAIRFDEEFKNLRDSTNGIKTEIINKTTLLISLIQDIKSKVERLNTKIDFQFQSQAKMIKTYFIITCVILTMVIIIQIVAKFIN